MLLLDEPFEGLSPAIIPEVSEGIHAITRLGRSILPAESKQAAEKGPSAALARSRTRCGVPGVRLGPTSGGYPPFARRLASGPF